MVKVAKGLFVVAFLIFGFAIFGGNGEESNTPTTSIPSKTASQLQKEYSQYGSTNLEFFEDTNDGSTLCITNRLFTHQGFKNMNNGGQEEMVQNFLLAAGVNSISEIQKYNKVRLYGVKGLNQNTFKISKYILVATYKLK